MLARYPQPADLDKDGKLDQRPSESISMLRSSPGALRAWRATVECKSINLLNQIPRTHAVRGIQTWARQGRAFSDALPPQAVRVGANYTKVHRADPSRRIGRRRAQRPARGSSPARSGS